MRQQDDIHESESKALDLIDASICGEFECTKATNWLCQWCSCSWTYQIQEYYFVLKLDSLTLTELKQYEYHRTKTWQNLYEHHWYQDTADAKRCKMRLLEDWRVKRWKTLQNRCWNCCLKIQSNFQGTFWRKQRHKTEICLWSHAKLCHRVHMHKCVPAVKMIRNAYQQVERVQCLIYWQ